jgi:hypothetical protein
VQSVFKAMGIGRAGTRVPLWAAVEMSHRAKEKKRGNLGVGGSNLGLLIYRLAVLVVYFCYAFSMLFLYCRYAFRWEYVRLYLGAGTPLGALSLLFACTLGVF